MSLVIHVYIHVYISVDSEKKLGRGHDIILRINIGKLLAKNLRGCCVFIHVPGFIPCSKSTL